MFGFVSRWQIDARNKSKMRTKRIMSPRTSHTHRGLVFMGFRGIFRRFLRSGINRALEYKHINTSSMDSGILAAPSVTMINALPGDPGRVPSLEHAVLILLGLGTG